MRIKKELLILYVLAFNLVFGFTLVSSFLPIYLSDAGVSLASIGFIFAFGAVAAGMIRFPIGSFADRYGRRPLMLIGAVGYPIFALGIALAHNISHFIGLKIFIELFGAIFWTAFWAYLYDHLTRKHEGVQISMRNMSVGLGAVCAPILAGFIIKYYSFIHLFYLSAGVGVISLVIIMMIKEKKKIGHRISLKELEQEYVDIFHRGKFRIYLAIGCLHNAGWVVWYIYMPIYLRSIGVSMPLIGTLLTVYYLFGILMQIPSGRLIDRVHSKYLIIPGFFIVWAAGYSFLLMRNYVHLVISRMFMGAGYDLTWSPLVARLSHITPKKHHGSSVAFFRAINALVVAITSVVAGYIASIYGIKIVLWGASSLALVVAFLLMFVKAGLLEKGRAVMKRRHHMHFRSPHRHR